MRRVPKRANMYGDVLDRSTDQSARYLGGADAACTFNATLTTTFLAINGLPFFLPLES